MPCPRFLLAAAGFAALTGCSNSPPPAGPPADSLVDQLGVVGQLTAGGGYLYWSQLDDISKNQWSIHRIVETGGAAELLASGVAQPQGLALDASNVYWTDAVHNAVSSVPVTGIAAGATPAFVQTELTSPTSIVVVGRTAYVQNDLGLLSTAIVAIGLDDGVVTPVGTQSDGWFGPLATDGTALYFVTDDLACFSGASCAESTVMRYAAGDTAPTVVYASSTMIDDYMIDGGTIYLAARAEAQGESTDDILSVPIAGGSPTTLATGLGPNVAFAMTSVAVSWTDGSGVRSVPSSAVDATSLIGDRIMLLAGDQSGVFAVATTPQGNTAVVALSPSGS